MILKTLDRFVEMAAQKGRRRIVVAVAQDEDVLKAIKTAIEKNLITPVLIGDRPAIQKAAELIGLNLKQIEIINEIDQSTACRIAVKYIHEGNGDILMKGLVKTGQLVRAVLDKETGLLKGGLLSHLAFFESPYYHKIFSVTDAALNIAPDLDEKASIIRNAVSTYHQLGIENPLVAVLAPVETVNPKMESTQHGEMLKQMQKNKQINGCIIDGPLALDLAVSYVAAKHKGVVSEVAGNADILLAHDLNAGNLLYKSLNFLGGALSAAIVCGATVPVVLTSRADDDRSKFLSIALAVAIA
jgi:phosphate butyryltransferase